MSGPSLLRADQRRLDPHGGGDQPLDEEQTTVPA